MPDPVARGAPSAHRRAERLSRSLAVFDADYYTQVNPDVIEAGCDPLEHYVTYGRLEGRFPNAAFAAAVDGIVHGYHTRQAP